MKDKFTLLSLLTLSILIAAPAQAENSMQQVFDQINANGNMTSPAVIQGQTMQYGTGGSLFMRTPKKTYNLVSVTPPSWGAGCGGIDLYLGGFGYINKDAFVAMAKNIGSNALGYGFKLALQNLCPTCDNVMQAMQSAAQIANRLNIDSCEAAKGIVNAATATMELKGREQSAMSFGTYKNIFSDMTEAWTSVKGNQSKADSATDQAAAASPELNDHRPQGNITWKALKKMNGIDDDYRMILMSMVGTTVFKNGQAPLPYNRRINTITDILGQAGQTNVTLPIWRCTDGTDANKCTVMTQATITKKSFHAMVGQKMQMIIDHIADRKAYTNAPELIQFVNVTDIPVYKMLAVATRYNNQGIAIAMMNNYQDLIAAKYAQVYIEQAALDLRTALDHYMNATTDATTAEEVARIKEELQVLVNDTRQTMMDAHSRTVTSYNIGLEVQHMERALNSNLSQSLRQSISFGNSLK